MRDISLTYEHSLIDEQNLLTTAKKLIPEITHMNQALSNEYNDDRASLNLVSDQTILKQVQSLIEKKQALHPTYIIVVGIGGSNLGTIAVQEAILGKLYNQQNPTTKILFADTVDSDSLHDIISIITPVLQKGENVLINGVSKSGGTTETIANFEILIDVVKTFKKDYQNYLVITSDKDSKYWNLAKENGFDLLEIPKKVGGRFSVFSPVGLFPLGMIGINLQELLNGAHQMRTKCLSDNLKENPAALSATLIDMHHKTGKTIHDMFLFNTDLESIGKWYRQLMGESIGKEYNINGEQIFTGITPTVSIGSTDLHSMAQLYLGGPFDKFTTFIRVQKNKNTIYLPDFADYEQLVPNIQKSSLQRIMTAILEGVQAAYCKGKRPFVEITIPEKTAFYIGQLLQMKMIEMMFLGYLLHVNPFDQPNVEAYKIETKKILDKKI